MPNSIKRVTVRKTSFSIFSYQADWLDTQVEKGAWASRSEGVRYAIDFLRDVRNYEERNSLFVESFQKVDTNLTKEGET